MDKKRILVFPCGSEVGLEIYRSLCYSRHIELIGGNSIDDHGKFIYKNYIGDLPFINSPLFISKLKEIINHYNIDAVYPTMDEVVYILKKHEIKIGCKVISASLKTVEICLSKVKTYDILKDKVRTPKIFLKENEICDNDYPVFVKPIIGYGSRGTKKAKNKIELLAHLKEYPNCIISEYLEGEEYTIDCFTDKNGKLRFVGARVRNRIKMGISVNTKIVKDDEEFKEMANRINQAIQFRGAWFFQLKKNKLQDLVLMEVASRLGGSSALYRMKGVNFALLSVFDIFDNEINIQTNNYNIEFDRALSNRYKMDIIFNTAYVDFDDCLIINESVNTELLKVLYQFLNKGIQVILLSRHQKDIYTSLKKYRLSEVFDKIIHIGKSEKKSTYVTEKNSIFIDDSFAEREEVLIKKGIPVFAPDMVESLITT
jgi:hypothetical protein